MTPLAPNPVPAPANLPTDPRFVQRDHREILRLVKRLITEELATLLSFGAEGDVIHTRLLDLSDDGRSVFAEWGPDDAVSQRVIDAGPVSCQAEIDNVRLHFVLEPKAGRLRYEKVFVARLPDLVFRVQRREYFRLPIRPQDRVVCSLVLPRPDGTTRTADVQLVDLSGGGMALCVAMALGAQLRLHVELAGCTLDLADAGTLPTRLRIRNLSKVAVDDGEAWIRVGAQFLDLRVGHIAQVQRFIGHIERRRRDEERRRAELEARTAAARAAHRR